MLSSYFKIALRNLQRHPGYTAINVFGFSIGLACCLFIALYVRHELSFDRFHEKADRIYRLVVDANIGSQEIQAPLSSAPVADALFYTFPEVEHVARIFRSEFLGAEGVTVERDEHRFIESRFYYVDSTLFDVFSFELIHGEQATALTEPNTVVLTEETALKYFGVRDPLGEVLRVNDEQEYTVTGVVANVPSTSHWQFDFIASLSTLPVANEVNWFGNRFSTYFVLHEGADIRALTEKIRGFVKTNVGPELQARMGVQIEDFLAKGGRYNYVPQALTDIHLHSDLSYEIGTNSDIRYVYAFLVVAFLILAIAAFNFTNLATARSASRFREVGVRKVLGSNRNQLMAQFLMESLLLCSLAMATAVGIVWASLPSLNTWLGTSLTIPFDVLWFGLGVGAGVVVVGLLSGIYPAFYLTAFMPATVLKGVMKRGTNGQRMRSSLVVAQFTISMVLMATTGLVYQQIRYVQDQKMGFDSEHVVIVERGGTANQQSEAFKMEVERLPEVMSVSAMENIPGRVMGDDAFRTPEAAADDFQIAWVLMADSDVVETLGFSLIDGEGFSPDVNAESPRMLVNQAAAQLFDWEFPLEGQLTSPFGGENDMGRVYDIVGVVEDFHFQSLHEKIKPLVIELSNDLDMEFMAIRLQGGRINEAINSIEAVWNTFYPGEPLALNFLDQQVDNLYRADRQHGQLLSVFAGLAIFIACLGLFGLAAYMTEQRVKEVGVRKVLGASVSSIVVLFSFEFLKHVALAFLIGIPFALYAMEQWLSRFAYTVEISWTLFAVTGLVAMAIALVTISYHAIHAALTNPVDTLKYE